MSYFYQKSRFATSFARGAGYGLLAITAFMVGRQLPAPVTIAAAVLLGAVVLLGETK